MSEPKVPMTARTRRVVLADVLEAVPMLRRVEEAVRILKELEAAGYPSGTTETSLGGATHCDPTGQAAVAAAVSGRRPDEMLAKVEDLDRALFRVRDLLHDVAATITWATTTTDAPGAEGCWFCARVPHANNHQPVYTRMAREAQNPASLSVPVCSWHYEFRDRYEVNPAPAVVTWHLDHLGARVPHAEIRAHHPVEFTRYHQARRLGA